MNKLQLHVEQTKKEIDMTYAQISECFKESSKIIETIRFNIISFVDDGETITKCELISINEGNIYKEWDDALEHENLYLFTVVDNILDLVQTLYYGLEEEDVILSQEDFK